MGRTSPKGPGNMCLLADQALMPRPTLRPKEVLKVGGGGREGGGGVGGDFQSLWRGGGLSPDLNATCALCVLLGWKYT